MVKAIRQKLHFAPVKLSKQWTSHLINHHFKAGYSLNYLDMAADCFPLKPASSDKQGFETNIWTLCVTCFYGDLDQRNGTFSYFSSKSLFLYDYLYIILFFFCFLIQYKSCYITLHWQWCSLYYKEQSNID